MATSPQFTLISICSGIAGLDLGVKLACPQAETICYVENEITAAEKLVARIEDGMLDDAPIWSDLKTFSGRPWRGRVDYILAGYPCQPFSCAGKQKGKEDPRHLWPHVARIIREVEPAGVFLENVSNHLRLGFYEVARELREMGYRIEAGLFSAAEVGAPHLRKRLFVLAHCAGRGLRELWQSPGRDGLAHRSGAELAHATSGRSHGEASQQTPRALPRTGNTELGNTERARRDGRTRQGLRVDGPPLQAPRSGIADRKLADAGVRLLPLAGRGSRGRNGARPAGANMANAGRAARGGRENAQQIERPRPPDNRRGASRELADASGIRRAGGGR